MNPTSESPQSMPEDAVDATETVEVPKPPDVSPALEIHDEPVKERPGLKELRRRQEIRAGIEPLYKMARSGEFDNSQIVQLTRNWAERHGSNEETLAETLKYFELAESCLVKFPPEQKVEIACALAELIADGTLDAETLQALAFKVVKRESGGSMDKVCEYSGRLPGIIVYDELFQDIDGVPQNIVHILKHEIAHGLRRYGEIGKDEESTAKAGGLIADAENLRQRESYRSINAIDQYLSVKNREGVTPEEIKQIEDWLSEELMSEKIAAYLQSGGEFGGFLNAIWRVMPAENQRNLMKDKTLLDAWTEENRFFFEKIKSQMADKSALKERILASTAEARERLEEEEFGDDFDYEGFVGEGGFGEPAVPDNSKAPDKNGGGDNIWTDLAAMGEAFSEVAEEVVPITEITKKAS